MNTETLQSYAEIIVRTKVSVSGNSVGFMIGSEDMHITGIREYGTVVMVSENGRRVI